LARPKGRSSANVAQTSNVSGLVFLDDHYSIAGLCHCDLLNGKTTMLFFKDAYPVS